MDVKGVIHTPPHGYRSLVQLRLSHQGLPCPKGAASKNVTGAVCATRAEAAAGRDILQLWIQHLYSQSYSSPVYNFPDFIHHCTSNRAFMSELHRCHSAVQVRDILKRLRDRGELARAAALSTTTTNNNNTSPETAAEKGSATLKHHQPQHAEYPLFHSNSNKGVHNTRNNTSIATIESDVTKLVERRGSSVPEHVLNEAVEALCALGWDLTPINPNPAPNNNNPINSNSALQQASSSSSSSSSSKQQQQQGGLRRSPSFPVWLLRGHRSPRLPRTFISRRMLETITEEPDEERVDRGEESKNVHHVGGTAGHGGAESYSSSSTVHAKCDAERCLVEPTEAAAGQHHQNQQQKHQQQQDEGLVKPKEVRSSLPVELLKQVLVAATAQQAYHPPTAPTPVSAPLSSVEPPLLPPKPMQPSVFTLPSPTFSQHQQQRQQRQKVEVTTGLRSHPLSWSSLSPLSTSALPSPPPNTTAQLTLSKPLLLVNPTLGPSPSLSAPAPAPPNCNIPATGTPSVPELLTEYLKGAAPVATPTKRSAGVALDQTTSVVGHPTGGVGGQQQAKRIKMTQPPVTTHGQQGYSLGRAKSNVERKTHGNNVSTSTNGMVARGYRPVVTSNY